MEKVKSEVTRLSATREVVKELWHCKNCGHDEYRTHTVDTHDDYSGGGGFFPGGSFGSSHSSGGFGGFGGGSSGGGGAGGRF